jgi:hypothetical protein
METSFIEPWTYNFTCIALFYRNCSCRSRRGTRVGGRLDPWGFLSACTVLDPVECNVYPDQVYLDDICAFRYWMTMREGVVGEIVRELFFYGTFAYGNSVLCHILGCV